MYLFNLELVKRNNLCVMYNTTWYIRKCTIPDLYFVNIHGVASWCRKTTNQPRNYYKWHNMICHFSSLPFHPPPLRCISPSITQVPFMLLVYLHTHELHLLRMINVFIELAVIVFSREVILTIIWPYYFLINFIVGVYNTRYFLEG